MKVWALVTVARQVQGEYIAVKIEKAFTRASKADEASKSLAKQFTETLQTGSGPIECLCERGVVEIDVDEGE
jgi:hypothetical protein